MSNPDESWHECEQELKRETHAREAAEAELRETVGELERVTGLARATAEALDKALVKCTDRGTRLTEATALLESFSNALSISQATRAGCGDEHRAARAFLASRAPAQLAAPTPADPSCIYAVCKRDGVCIYPKGDGCEMLSRTPSPPIALPTEEPCGMCNGGGYCCGMVCACMKTQPAAPEPSAESTRAELERANQKIIGAERLLLRASRCVELDDWRDDYDTWMSGGYAPATNELLCYEGDCAKMTGRPRPCPIHDAQMCEQIEAAVAKRLEAAIMNALRYEREESHRNTTRRAESAESQLASVRDVIARKHSFIELADAFGAIEDMFT